MVQKKLLSKKQAEVYGQLRQIGVSPLGADRWVRKRISRGGRMKRKMRRRKKERLYFGKRIPKSWLRIPNY